MRNLILLILIGVILFLAAFVTFEGTELRNGGDSASSVSTVSSAAGSQDALKMPDSLYREYTEGVIAKNDRNVLFFSASGCAFCEQNDALLRQWAASGSLKLPVYKVDFETAAGLKITYTVILRDTFVLVGRNGGKLKSVIHPSEDELKNLVLGKI